MSLALHFARFSVMQILSLWPVEVSLSTLGDSSTQVHLVRLSTNLDEFFYRIPYDSLLERVRQRFTSILASEPRDRR